MNLEKNIGPKNRTVRTVLGVILSISGFYLFTVRQDVVLALVAGLFALIFFWEAAKGYCIVHGILGTKDMR